MLTIKLLQMDRFIGDVKTEAVKEEPSQISTTSLFLAITSNPNSAETAVELVKEKMKKRANGEVTILILNRYFYITLSK